MHFPPTLSAAAVVLAAGASRRMGCPKAFLETPDGGTFLGEILAVAGELRLSPVVIVTSAELASAMGGAAPGAIVLVNPEPARGQLSSLQLALETICLGENSGTVMFTVDSPGKLLQRTGLLMGINRENPDSIVQCGYEGKPGHPVWLPARSFGLIQQWQGPEGLRGFIASGAFPTRLLETPHPECLADIDTPQRYRDYLGH